mmetsp:Transcript_46258/g.100570  ORF Transcript_46258/g.100570 Transcript_46258/m.100570 type:complete len:495 (-) Transcript_46258:140-1624(-)
MARATTALNLLVLLASVSWSAAAPGSESDALQADDSCSADGASCTTELLQQRAVEKLEKATSKKATPHSLLPCEGSVLTTEEMTAEDYDGIIIAFTGAFDALDQKCEANDCPVADVTGCVLRMAGHDFMDYTPSLDKGGSDACTDMDEADNAGLSACLVDGEHGFKLADIYATVCTKVSLADFIVIAAEAAMTYTRGIYLKEFPDRGDIDFKGNFKYGRTTATECDFAAHVLPNPENGCSDVERVFVNNIGLKWSHAAALMGVHSLGRASTSNSGYDGWWSDAENSRRFNNNYFTSMLLKGWMPERAVGGNSAKNQWLVSDNSHTGVMGKEMMLDTDMCLAFSTGLMSFEDIHSASSDCCTWTMPVNVIDAIYNYNDGVFCGVNDAEKVKLWLTLPKGDTIAKRQEAWELWQQETGLEPNAVFREMRAACCQGQDKYRREFKEYEDCGAVSHPTGQAIHYVMTYANDEKVWLKDFLDAWGRATKRGYAKLKGLS